jgi:hypothetical protein
LKKEKKLVWSFIIQTATFLICHSRQKKRITTKEYCQTSSHSKKNIFDFFNIFRRQYRWMENIVFLLHRWAENCWGRLMDWKLCLWQGVEQYEAARSPCKQVYQCLVRLFNFFPSVTII